MQTKNTNKQIIFLVIITIASFFTTIFAFAIYALPKFLYSRYVKKNTLAKYKIIPDTTIAGIIIGAFYLIGISSDDIKDTAKNQDNSVIVNEVYTEMPKTEITFQNQDEKGVAPFTVNTKGENGYFARLVNKATDEAFVEMFIRGGESIEVKVPLGEYELRYITGKNWVGYTEPDFKMFGKDTIFMKADTILNFYQDEKGYIGHSVLLYLVPNGNLSTSQINPDDF